MNKLSIPVCVAGGSGWRWGQMYQVSIWGFFKMCFVTEMFCAASLD